jgi:hypothetical protein
LSLSLVVLAAGEGRRYGGLKQLDPLGPGGATLAEYAVFDAIAAGFGHVVFVVRGELLAEMKSSWGVLEERTAVDWAEQRLDDLPGGASPPAGRRRPWGTGHAVLAAERYVPGDFAVVNADDFYGADAYESAAAFLREAGEAHAAVGYPLRDTLSEAGSVNRGLLQADARGWLEKSTEVIGIERHGGGARAPDGSGGFLELDGSERVSMNFWAFRHGLFAELRRELERFTAGLQSPETDEFFLSSAVEDLIGAGRARVRLLESASRWCGLTRPEDRERSARHLAALVARGDYPERLWG